MEKRGCTPLEVSLDALSLRDATVQEENLDKLGAGGPAAAEEDGGWDSDGWAADVSAFKSVADHESAVVPSTCCTGPAGPAGTPCRTSVSKDTPQKASHLRSVTPPTAKSDEWDEDAEAVPRQQTPLSALPFDGVHVLEFYELTAADTSTHLESFLAQFGDGRLAPIAVRRWVDENTALAICTDPESAQRMLQRRGKYKLRPFARASEGARCLPPQQLAPPRPRPTTSAAVARRLIGNALGNSAAVRDRAGEAQLAAAQREKAAAKLRRQAGIAAAWGDD